MRKRVFGQMRTAMAQITLRIRVVWSGPSLFANRLDITEYTNGEQRSGWQFAHAHDDLNLCILRMFEGTFSSNTVDYMMFSPK